MENQSNLSEEEMEVVAKLYKDRALARLFVSVIDNTVPRSDPRREGAMEHYKSKVAEKDEAITAITGVPPKINVQLKTAVLTGKSELGE